MPLNFFQFFGDWGLGIGDWGLGPIPNPQLIECNAFLYLIVDFDFK